MVYGYVGGYSRRSGRYPRSYVRGAVDGLRRSTRTRRHVRVDVVDGDTSVPARCEMYAGDVDMGFLLPGTDALTASSRVSNEVYIRGLRVAMELCVSRNCSMRVMAWWSTSPRTHSVYAVRDKGVDVKLGALRGNGFAGAGYGRVDDPSTGVGYFCSVPGNLPFSETDSRPLFFRAVDRKKGRNVLLDRVHHFRVGSQLQFRPFDVWLPVYRLMRGRSGDADGLYRIGRESDVEYNLHVLFLLHVPSFSLEGSLRDNPGGITKDLGKVKMDVDDQAEVPDSQGEEDDEAGPSVGKKRKRNSQFSFTFRSSMRPMSGIAEVASGLVSDDKGVALPALEVRQMATTIFYTEEGRLFAKAAVPGCDGRFVDEIMMWPKRSASV